MKIFTDKEFSRVLAQERERIDKERWMIERMDRLCESVGSLEERVQKLEHPGRYNDCEVR